MKSVFDVDILVVWEEKLNLPPNYEDVEEVISRYRNGFSASPLRQIVIDFHCAKSLKLIDSTPMNKFLDSNK